MKKKVPLFFTILVILFCATSLFPQSFFERSSKTDLPLMSGALGGFGLSHYLGRNIKPLTLEELERLDQQKVPSFDRWACQKYSQKADDLSDILLYISALSPLLMFASPELDWDQKWTHGLMYIETGILTHSITEITKLLTRRIRPYAYNTEVPLTERMKSSGARKSFFSGHTSISFANAVFLAQTYSAIHPHSRWKPVVWGAGLSAATLVGILRVLSGKHFPSDVLVGAIVGSVIGFVIPKLHEVKPNTSHDSYRTFQVSFQLSF